MKKDQGKSGLVSKNIMINGHRTSIRLEPEMWGALMDIAAREQCSIHELSSIVGSCKRPSSTLTAAIRVFLMLYYKAATNEEGHNKAGHGDINRMRERVKRLSANSVVSMNGSQRPPLTPSRQEQRVSA